LTYNAGVKRAQSWGLVFLAVVAVGCGSSGGGTVTISTQPLAGMIGGQPWTFGTGETDSFLSTTTSLWVNLYAGSFTTCSGAAPSDADNLIMQMPNTAGSYNLGPQLNLTFYVAASQGNFVATRGRLQIDSVTATTISGGLNATYDGSNSVDGQFQAAICP
jgi:hypothetical protein